ncbi:MAG: glycosyltransferase family 2 protein [bacterium]
MVVARAMSGHTVSIIIPALNEERTIAGVIEGRRPFADQIIVVDGHSSDRTRDIAKNFRAIIIKDQKKGKGQALRQSALHATGDIIVFIDADGSHNPADIPKLIQPIIDGEADHVSASRVFGGSEEFHGGFREFIRVAGCFFITTCINVRFKVKLSESQNGFRAIKADIFKQLDLRENITTIEQEMIIKTLKKGFRIAEIPSHEHARIAGRSRISIRKVWFRYLYSLIKYLL